ncbi:hypothetical protein [Gimesia aquarii]|uniref:hypothetical protein n=1 Tax=Gimesia aquarii TaxID=2527964 RepID=UPI0011A9DD32|nr:hypothetical protein [Gimesia aquarii]
MPPPGFNPGFPVPGLFPFPGRVPGLFPPGRFPPGVSPGFPPPGFVPGRVPGVPPGRVPVPGLRPGFPLPGFEPGLLVPGIPPGRVPLPGRNPGLLEPDPGRVEGRVLGLEVLGRRFEKSSVFPGCEGLDGRAEGRVDGEGRDGILGRLREGVLLGRLIEGLRDGREGTGRDRAPPRDMPPRLPPRPPPPRPPRWAKQSSSQTNNITRAAKANALICFINSTYSIVIREDLFLSYLLWSNRRR